MLFAIATLMQIMAFFFLAVLVAFVSGEFEKKHPNKMDHKETKSFVIHAGIWAGIWLVTWIASIILFWMS